MQDSTVLGIVLKAQILGSPPLNTTSCSTLRLFFTDSSILSNNQAQASMRALNNFFTHLFECFSLQKGKALY